MVRTVSHEFGETLRGLWCIKAVDSPGGKVIDGRKSRASREIGTALLARVPSVVVRVKRVGCVSGRLHDKPQRIKFLIVRLPAK